jgi:hypothetical protein
LVGSQRRAAVYWSGLAAATGLLLCPQPVAAQILDPPETPTSVARRAPAKIAPDIPADDQPTPTVDDPMAANVPGEEAPSPETPENFETTVVTQQQDGVDTADDLDASDDDFGVAEARPKRVLLPRDGDPVTVFEPNAAPEGVIDIADPQLITGEENATLADLRTPTDLTVFAGSDAGFDPLVLQADETNPVFSDRVVRPFGPDPFAPLGTRIGSFVLFTEAETDGDYNSNLFASPEAVGDVALELRPAARLVSDWAVHALEVRASGDLSWHDRFPSEDDRAYLVEGLGRLDVTRRTNLQGMVGREFAQESRSAINASSAGSRPNITVECGRAALNHRFNRLSVQLRGAVIETSYGDDVLDGLVQSNADRDYILYEEAFRPKWEFTPNFFLFSDIAFNQRDYSIAAFTDGINRTSTGERYRAGVSFGNTGQILRGEVSLGYGRQTPDSPELEVIDGLLVDANLTWAITPLTTLLLTAATDVAETTTVDSGGVMERNYAAELRHSFTSRLIGIGGLGFFTRDFVGAGINENQLTAAAGLEYYMNRHAVLFGRYQHTVFDSSVPVSSYTVEEAQVGVRLRN